MPPSLSIAPSDQRRSKDISWPESSPLSSRSRRAERARSAVHAHVMLRPLRLTPVKLIVSRTPEDNAFIKFALLHDIPAVFLSPCPKSKDSVSGRRYMKYMRAKTLREALELGATRDEHLTGTTSVPSSAFPSMSPICLVISLLVWL